MTNSQKLHTAARRYCIERYHSQGPVGGMGTHYFFLCAIILEVERFDFDVLPDVAELCELLVLAAEVAVPFFGTVPTEETQREIRQQFARFVQNFDFTIAVEPLPYRRALFGAELGSIAETLQKQWDAGKDYYFPLDDVKSSHAPTLFAYNDVDFEEAIPKEKLATVLRSHGVNRIYEIREWGDENYLQDVELMNPSYTGAEVFISSEEWNWLFYASHEASITTGGWLTKAIQEEWPEWESAKYNPNW